MQRYALATIAIDQGDGAALVVDGSYYRLDRLDDTLPSGGVRALLEDWPNMVGRLDALAASLTTGDGSPAYVPAPIVLAPIRYPNKLLCAGAIYSDHLEQFDMPSTRLRNMAIFLRPPTTSIIGPGPARIPPGTEKMDWEVELAVIIGRRLTDGDEDDAKAAIAGYSIGIDFSCRDMFDTGQPTGADLLRGKAQDGMAPLGPLLVPAHFIGDPQALWLRLWVNDTLRQDGTTADMMFPVYEQVATISGLITLEPGDVIFTGSPAGSARGPGDYLKPGDRVRAEIEHLGTLGMEMQPPRHRPKVRAAA